MKNVFYFHHLNVIGGVENMFYELGKKYKDCIIDKITLEDLMVLIIKGVK